jgi:hypothetical protein
MKQADDDVRKLGAGMNATGGNVLVPVATIFAAASRGQRVSTTERTKK